MDSRVRFVLAVFPAILAPNIWRAYREEGRWDDGETPARAFARRSGWGQPRADCVFGKFGEDRETACEETLDLDCGAWCILAVFTVILLP